MNKNLMQVPRQSSRYSNIHAEALLLDQLKGARKYLLGSSIDGRILLHKSIMGHWNWESTF